MRVMQLNADTHLTIRAKVGRLMQEIKFYIIKKKFLQFCAIFAKLFTTKLPT